jgi:translation initiation factor 2 subunit 1
MPKRRGPPTPGELVVCRITKINPNSAFAELAEYSVEGMIHISEIASGWVRDIRRFVKPDQEVVAVVLRSEPLTLSMKRVNPNQKAAKTKEYNLEKRAEKMLEMTAQKLGKTLQQGYEEIGFMLQDRFGSMYEAYRTVLSNPEKVQKYLSAEWFTAVKEVAEKSIEQKEFEFSANLTLKSFAPDGISIIKDVLKKAEKSRLDVHYIAAPKYLVKYRTKDPKKGSKEFVEKLEKIVAEKGVEAKYEVIEQ